MILIMQTSFEVFMTGKKKKEVAKVVKYAKENIAKRTEEEIEELNEADTTEDIDRKLAASDEYLNQLQGIIKSEINKINDKNTITSLYKLLAHDSLSDYDWESEEDKIAFAKGKIAAYIIQQYESNK